MFKPTRFGVNRNIIGKHFPQLEARSNYAGVFTLKTHQMFFVRTTPKFQTQQSAVILDLYLRKTRSGYHIIVVDAIVFKKLRF